MFKKKKKTFSLIFHYLHPGESLPAPPTQTDPLQEEATTVSDRRRRHLEPLAPLPVAVVIVYKSLGTLLPERYDPDRRSLRYTSRKMWRFFSDAEHSLVHGGINKSPVKQALME